MPAESWMQQADIQCPEKSGPCLGQGHGVWKWVTYVLGQDLRSLVPNLQHADGDENAHVPGLPQGLMRWHTGKRFAK